MSQRWRAWALPGVIALAGLAWLIGTGASLRTSASMTLVIAAQTFSGAYLWQLIAGKRARSVEVLGIGMALGTALAVLSGLLVQLIGLGNWGWVLPAVIVTLVWIQRRATGRGLTPATSIDTPTLVALTIGAVTAFVALWLNVVRYPLAWTGTWSRYHPDMLFFEALSTSLARLGPLDSIFLSGGSIRYHWLVYAWSGQIAHATDAEPFVVLTRALPFVVSAMMVLLVVSWTRRLTKVGWAPALAVLLVITGGYVGASYGTILNFDSPSQSFTSAWLIALIIVFLRLVRTHHSLRTQGALLGVLLLFGFVIAGGKVSTAAIAVAATSFVAVIALVRRAPWWRPAFTGAVAIAAGSVAGFLLIVSGSADPGGLRLGQLLERASSVQGLNPLPGSLGIVAGTLILVVAIAFRWVGVLWLVTNPRSRWSPSTLMAVGLVIAGIGSILLISGGLNDTWFALAASAPLSVLSAVGVARAASTIGVAGGRVRPSVTVVLAAVLALVIAGITTALWLTGGSGGNVWKSTGRWLGPLVAVVLVLLVGALLARSPRLTGRNAVRFLAITLLVAVFASVPFRLLGFAGSAFGVQPETGLSADAFVPKEPFLDALDAQAIVEWDAEWNEAGKYLHSAVSDGELVATNVTFSPIVPALSGSATFVSGIQYQAPYGPADQLPELLRREQQIVEFLAEPTPAKTQDLCSQRVRWLWLDVERDGITESIPGAEPRFTGTSVRIYRLIDC